MAPRRSIDCPHIFKFQIANHERIEVVPIISMLLDDDGQHESRIEVRRQDEEH
jgi:hypothetical protein